MEHCLNNMKTIIFFENKFYFTSTPAVVNRIPVLFLQVLEMQECRFHKNSSPSCPCCATSHIPIQAEREVPHDTGHQVSAWLLYYASRASTSWNTVMLMWPSVLLLSFLELKERIEFDSSCRESCWIDKSRNQGISKFQQIMKQ